MTKRNGSENGPVGRPVPTHRYGHGRLPASAKPVPSQGIKSRKDPCSKILRERQQENTSIEKKRARIKRAGNNAKAHTIGTVRRP